MGEIALRRRRGVRDDLIADVEVIVVDDCSDDGTGDVLKRLAVEDSRVTLIRHDRNSGKGAAIRTAMARASGEICGVFDADLEYNPDDIPGLLVTSPYEDGAAPFRSPHIPAASPQAPM